MINRYEHENLEGRSTEVHYVINSEHTELIHVIDHFIALLERYVFDAKSNHCKKCNSSKKRRKFV